MRRNTVTLLKYIVAAAIIVTAGPLLLKSLTHQDARLSRGSPEDSVLPRDPETQRKVAQRNLGGEDADGKIDWHNHKQIEEDKKRTGAGEQGQAVFLSPDEDQEKQSLYKVNGFNALASDKIALNRSLRDIRHPDCKTKTYLSKLPTASVVVPFHNEHWTTLLRTATTVIERSPRDLIHEVILVDDFSTKEFLKQPLDDYLAKHLPKARVVRATKREGLIRARVLGAKAATGDVLIFLDSHCEAGINWLPPLLDPIAADWKTVVCPFIDVIDFETFAYRAQDEGARGAFDWEFFYKRLPLLPEDLKHPAEPFKSPVMAGGLFAINRKWFWELGGYDPGLDIWGGEQYELSFKIWQCGGQMVDAPCSRVGHIYRKFAPFPNPGIGDFVGKNYRRVAVVWMDEFAEYLYKRRPHYRNIDPGDLTEQKAVRTRLQCKPFKWFMEEVAFDLTKKYPPIEPPDFASGELRNVGSNMCVDTRFKGTNERFTLEQCVRDNPNAGGEQSMVLSWRRDVHPSPNSRRVCFDASSSTPKSPVLLWECHLGGGNQLWNYRLATRQLFHPVTSLCMDGSSDSKEIFMNTCDENSPMQKWQFQHVNTTALAQYQT